MAEIGFFIDILLGFPGPSDGLRLHSIVFFSSGSGLTADSSVLTLTLAFLDFGLDFAQSFPFHAQFCHFGLVDKFDLEEMDLKWQGTLTSPSPKADKRYWNGLMSKKLGLGYGFTEKACFKGKGTGQGENRPVNMLGQHISSQAAATSTAKKVNTAKPIDDPQKALMNKGIVDSGCSRHMTGNKAYLVEYQDYNGGPVSFGGSKGQITKNKVLFTDSECLVLSPDFKFLDKNQVLLRVPRQNNMYSFNLENIVPTRGLACLIAKATVDESNKWHRRMGHGSRGNTVMPELHNKMELLRGRT
ncbi:hypothetical protein Tco_0291457 [Tanacetum coccineum]